ncbi:hypothetical protein [Fusobacterium polymorphum]|uniref:hypothetical protein n=1 Tax=Fusobacterium nucleatum subsp. polymorphum TaxID=76857 RepID=UPI0030098991
MAVPIKTIVLVTLSKKLFFLTAQSTPIGILKPNINKIESPASFNVTGSDLAISS